MRILLFAHLKNVAGCAELDLPGDNLDVDTLWRKLGELRPALSPFRSSVRLARNWEYVDAAARFGNTDEIALIPPVSGG